MLNESSAPDQFMFELLSCKSTEYREFFNRGDDITTLAQGATDIIKEVKNMAIRGECESHLGDLLSALLDSAPCPQGQRYVAIALHVAHEHGSEMVIEVAKTWRSLFFDITSQFIKAKPLPKFDFAFVDEELESVTGKDLKHLIRTVAERERYYCGISGDFDSRRVHQLLRQNRPLPPYTTVVPMQAVYIIPLPPNLFESQGASGKKTVALMRAVFKAWTCLDKLKINDPCNAIYMTPDLGTLFRGFDFYLKAESRNQDAYRAYEVMGKRPLFHGMLATDVTFNHSDEEGIPIVPPNPELLKVQAALAQVSYLSGIYWEFQCIESDSESEEEY